MPADLSLTARLAYGRSTKTLIGRYAAARSLRSAVLWGYVFGVTVASSALSYSRIYKTPAERARLAATFGANHAASALFGPAPQLQTVAGFTVFKVSMTLTIIGAVWGLLTSTRLLRGDEDEGRWELLVSGRTTRGGAVAQVLAGLGVAATILWVITALVTVVVGRASSVRIDATGGLYLALALVASAVVFLAVGAVLSQLAANRRQAAGYAAVVLGASYGLRMVADAGAGVHWLVWASPLGWVEQLQPLTDPEPWALVPLAAFTAAMAALAVFFAGRRDVGSSMLPEHSTRTPRLLPLAGPTTLALRLTRSSMLSWTVAIALAGLLTGIVARAAGATIVGSSVQQVLSRLGARGTGTAAFLGFSFVILAIVIAFEAASQVGAARVEEAEGRIDRLVSGNVGRCRWILGRFALATVALLLGGIVAGVASWIGVATQGSSVGVLSMLDAGVNAVPPAVFVLGVGGLAIGLWPRRAVGVTFIVLGWSALVDLVGGFFAQSHWVLDTSLFHQMASAPATAPNWQINGVLAGLGVAAIALGTVAFGRRDLEGQ